MTRYDLIDFSFDTDLEPLRDHFRRCFQESYGSLLSKTSMAHLLEGLRSDDIGGLLPPPDAERVLACVEGEIVGSAIWARRGGQGVPLGLLCAPFPATPKDRKQFDGGGA